MFCDLNLPFDRRGHEDLERRLARAFRLGYTTVAINVLVDQSDLGTKKKRKLDAEKPMMAEFPSPPATSCSIDGLKVLTRLTVSFSDNNVLPFFAKSSTASKYDLLALAPSSAAALSNVLKSGFRFDLVAFDAEKVRDVRWTRKLYADVLEKGAFFELSYGKCVSSAELRRRTISQAHNFHAVGKSRRIVLTSAAENASELRSPFDAANLGFIFGLNEQQGKDAVGRLPRETLRAAQGRRLGPFRVVVNEIKPEEDAKAEEEAD